jgi:type II secretory pathway component PulF
MTTGEARGAVMKAGWKVFWASLVVVAVAYGLARVLVPDVVPIGDSEEPQASWAVLTAFALQAIELTAAWVAAIAFTLMAATWALRWLRRAKHPTGQAG